MHSKMTFHKDRLCGALKTLNVLLDLEAENSEFDKLHRPFQKIIYCNPKRSKSVNFTLMTGQGRATGMIYAKVTKNY